MKNLTTHKFIDTEVTAIIQNGEKYAHLPEMCDILGLKRTGQMEKFRKRPDEFRVITPEVPSSYGGRVIPTNMLHVDDITEWVRGININRKDRTRESIDAINAYLKSVGEPIKVPKQMAKMFPIITRTGALETIQFHDDEIYAFKDEKTGLINISVRKMCEVLGIDYRTQRDKLLDDPRYHAHLCYFESSHKVEGILNFASDKDLFLEYTWGNDWLHSINAKKIGKPEIAQKLSEYQRKAAIALFQYFHEGVAVNPDAVKEDPAQVAANLKAQLADIVADAVKEATAQQTQVTSSREIELRRRMQLLQDQWEIFGEPDEEEKKMYRQQLAADTIGTDPAETLPEIDRWYVMQYWREYKKETGAKMGTKQDGKPFKLEGFRSQLGRYVREAAEDLGVFYKKVAQQMKSGRHVRIGQSTAEAIKLGIERMAENGGVVYPEDDPQMEINFEEE